MFVPIVNLVDWSSQSLGIHNDLLRQSLQEYVDRHVGPVWGVGADLRWAEPGEGWELYFLDDMQQADALGFHGVEADQLPRGFVLVSEAKRHGEPVSVVASHELAEMLVNPAGNRLAWTPRGRVVAWEICDPVQRERFKVLDQVEVSDFVHPSWFGIGQDLPYDHVGIVAHPWEILPGGYMPAFDCRQWYNLLGDTVVGHRLQQDDRRLHRNERLNRRSRSDVVRIDMADRATHSIYA